PGATPHNIAVAAAARAFPGAPVLTGLNLPMLLRALNHCHRAAAELAELAEHGAHAATFIGERDED
ncbi:MAG: PTS fructose transporter subunit IIA, partial [Wenzhouxiangellaceae bacterium]